MPVSPSRGILVTLLAASTLPLVAETTTLQPVADTSIWELDPDYNFGTQWTLPAGTIGRMFPASLENSRVLYKFNLAGAVPSGAVIESARMKLAVAINGVPNNPSVADFSLSRVLVDWGEGVGRDDNPGGDPALPGEATWNNRFHPDMGWSTPGGAFGTDFASSVIAVAPNVAGDPDNATTYFFNFNAAGLVELQDMIDGTTPNHGWVLYSTDTSRRTARRWTSREARLANHGPIPELEITWSMPELRLELGVSYDRAAEELVVRLAGQAGFRYELQCGDDLETWTPGESQSPTEDGEITFRVPGSAVRKFVRVEAVTVP